MKNIIIIAIVVVVAACAAFYFTHKNFVLGRLGMSFTSKPVPASLTDSIGEAQSSGRRVLVAYFSWGGNTREVAQEIHKIVGGDIVEIRSANEYPSGYKDTVNAAKPEFDDELLPEIEFAALDMSDYDIVLLGYPIWYYRAPRVIASFLNSVDTSGKTILPFATSGGSDIDGSIPHIAAATPNATMGEPLLANDTSLIADWIKRNVR